MSKHKRYEVMGKKIGRHDLCWCGSGLEYKYCHLNRSNDEPVKLQEQISWLKKAYGKEYCLHPDASLDNCAKEIAKAHTVQRRNGGLSRIARASQVYNFVPDLPTLINKKPIQPKLIGIKLASTFTGFCSEHDGKTFEPIEKHPFQSNQHHSFLLGYRAFCKELFLKKAMAEQIKLMRTLDKGKGEVEQVQLQGFLNFWNLATDYGLRDATHYKKIYDDALLRDDYSQVQFYVIRFDCTPDFLCSAFITPKYSFNGELLQNFFNVNVVLDHLAFSLITTDIGGAAVFSWLGVNNASKQFIYSLHSIPDNQVANAIARFTFEQVENVFIAPDWFDKLDDVVKEKILQRQATMQITPESFLNDGLKYVSWKVVTRDTNIIF